MIKQERLEQALKFLSETDEQHAKLIAGVDYLKDLAKNMKGKFIVNCESEKSVAMKEHAWYASDHYKKHIDEKRALVEEATKLENNRAKENLIIDVWRTLEASRRIALISCPLLTAKPLTLLGRESRKSFRFITIFKAS